MPRPVLDESAIHPAVRHQVATLHHDLLAEVQAAVKKAVVAAKRHMIRIPLYEGSIPHAVNVKFKAAKIRLLPASKGTGIIAGGAVRVILENAGVRDVLSKRFGTGNKLVNAQATMKALGMLRGAPGMTEEASAPLKETEAAIEDSDALTQERDRTIAVQEVDRKDVIEEA